MSNKSLTDQLTRIQLGGIIIIILAYAPGVFKESFWSDDYPALMDTPSVVDHILKDARPTGALLFSSSFSLLDGPAHAWILRSLALIALLLIFLFISKRINNSKHRNIGIFSIAIAFCLPSFQMYVHWSSTWFFLWATLAGLYAFHFWSSKVLFKKLLAVFLLSLALTTYPPAALFFFAAIAIINTVNDSKISTYFSDALQGLLLLMTSGLFSVLTVVVILQFDGVSVNQRVSIITLSEIPAKIIWVISRPLVVGLRPFMIDSPAPEIALITAIPVILILIMGIRKQASHLSESVFVRAFGVAILLIFSLIPLLVTSDNQIEFRILPGYSWGIAALAAFFLLEIIETWLRQLSINSNFKTIALLVPPIVLTVLSITSVNSHYNQFFGTPYEKKTAFLNSQISSCLDDGAFKRVVILPPEMPFPTLTRLGVFSMTTDLASSWVPKPNVELLLKLRKIDVPVTYLEARPLNKESLPTNCVVDLEEFRKLLIKSLYQS